MNGEEYSKLMLAVGDIREKVARIEETTKSTSKNLEKLQDSVIYKDTYEKSHIALNEKFSIIVLGVEEKLSSFVKHTKEDMDKMCLDLKNEVNETRIGISNLRPIRPGKFYWILVSVLFTLNVAWMGIVFHLASKAKGG